MTVESVARDGTVGKALIRGVIESVRGSQPRVQATCVHAAHRSGTATGKAAAMHPPAYMATAAMPTALRPHREGERQRKRRDRNQATHTRPL